ncbi:EF-hand domain-containing protein [Vibrio sp. TH_r3]|uniref:EF-hand domain-containing protein n=1 Tax=Vibrio sp. TH_r3 TaxID=3082084 RepID=UPI0029535B48|nr:EF-hand domain-containing protein [Vibrio sp. TH_r3]MDV7103771.1 EF-hand domain-containing protein [Vibrio sp. TH_r3]
MRRTLTQIYSVGILAVLTFSISACAPKPKGDRDHGPKPLSADELFERADSNVDGVLTKEELESAMPR